MENQEIAKIDELLKDKKKKDKLAQRRNIIFLLTTILFGAIYLIVVFMSVKQLEEKKDDLKDEKTLLEKEKKELKKEITQLNSQKNKITKDFLEAKGFEENSPINSKKVKTALKANGKIDIISNKFIKDDYKTQSSIQYYSKNSDKKELKRAVFALEDLGFNVKSYSPNYLVENEKTNSVFYDPNINIDEVKLVILALIRAGAEIKTIQSRETLKGTKLIQIGSQNRPDRPKKPYTVEEVYNAKKFTVM